MGSSHCKIVPVELVTMVPSPSPRFDHPAKPPDMIVAPAPYLILSSSHSLINFYSKCGYSSNACLVLDEMPKPDVISWAALIQGFMAQSTILIPILGASGFLVHRLRIIIASTSIWSLINAQHVFDAMTLGRNWRFLLRTESISHVSVSTMFHCFTNEPASLIVVFFMSTVTFEYHVIGVLTPYNWAHTYVEFKLLSLAHLRSMYSLKALPRGVLDLSVDFGKIAFLLPMAQGDSSWHTSLKIIGLFKVLLVASCLHIQVAVMGILLDSIVWSSILNWYTDGGCLLVFGFINVIRTCLTFWRILLLFMRKEESKGNIEAHVKPIGEVMPRDVMKIVPGAIIFSFVFYEYFKYVGSKQGTTLFLASKIQHWKQLCCVTQVDGVIPIRSRYGEASWMSQFTTFLKRMDTPCTNMRYSMKLPMSCFFQLPIEST